MHRSITAFLVLLALLSPAYSAYLTNWETWEYSPEVDVPDLDSPPALRYDITQAWYQTDGTNAYFRMDLAAAPAVGNNFERWGIYLNATQFEGGNGDDVRVPSQLLGIDRFMERYYDTTQSQGGGVPGTWHTHYAAWNTGTNDWDYIPPGPDQAQYTENGGTTFEWSMPLNYTQQGGLNAYFVTWDNDANDNDIAEGGSDAVVYDIVLLNTPEPTSLGLFAFGLGAVLMRRRRRQQ